MGVKGKAGRKPKPNHLKLVEGNPGKRKINRNEPKVGKPKSLAPPSWLDAEGKRQWRWLIPKLETMGILGDVDLRAAAMWCDSWATYQAAKEHVAENGLMVWSTQGAKKNPACTVMQEAFQRMRSLGASFGWTPSDRATLKVETKPEIDSLEVALRGK